MRIFALGDPHLPGGRADKPMHRFGPRWWHHREKILRRAWQTVGTEDLLLLPGDLSWATKRRDAQEDLAFLAGLPGIKICIKGNHDFWWESDKPIGHPGLLSAPQVFGKIGIAGTRGWDDSDPAIVRRERARLVRSLERVAGCEKIIAMLHYPPHLFIDILASFGVRACVYGHIHEGSLPADEALVLNGETLEGIPCWCTACDRINFTPLLVQ